MDIENKQTVKGTLTTDTDDRPLFIREDGERFRLAWDERSDELIWCAEHSGEIYSSDRKQYINTYPVSYGGKRKDDHRQVCIYDERDNGWMMAKAHQMIARAWLKHTPSRTHVHHINRDPADNDSSNLLWVDDISDEHNTLHGLLRHDKMEEYWLMVNAIKADNETNGTR